MRLKYLLLIAVSILFFSCEKEEQPAASDAKIGSRFEFPEGTPYDDLTAEIAEKFQTQLLWKKILPSDINRDWTVEPLAGEYNCNRLTEKQAGDYIHWMNDYVFKKLDPKLCGGVFKPYTYLVWDMRQAIMNILLAPVRYNFEGMDYWTISLEGRGIDAYPMYPTELPIFPTTEADILTNRGIIMKTIFEKMIKAGNVKIPDCFTTDFDYTKEFINTNGMDKDPNYVLNRGFIGQATSKFDINFKSGKKVTKENNFIAYMVLVAKYTEEQIKTDVKISEVLVKDFPKVLKYYKIVDQYMIDNYGFDLKTLHTL